MAKIQSNVKPFEPMKDKQGYFKEGERQKIFNSAETERDRLLIRLLWKTGRRVGEILQITVKDIDFKDSQILWHIEKKTIKTGEKIIKGVKKDIRKRYDKRVWKPIDKITKDMLEKYVLDGNFSPERHLFYSIKNPLKPISRQRVFQIVRECCEKSKIYFVGSKKPHPHNFRHSIAIDMAKNINSPSGLRIIQTFLEHSDVEMTTNYLQFGNQELRDLLNSLEESK